MSCCGSVSVVNSQFDMSDRVIENRCNCNRVSGPIWSENDCMSCWACIYRPEFIRGWNGSVAIIGPPPRKTIGVVARVVSFAKSTINHALHGFPKSNKTELKRRLEICTACTEHYNGMCMQCGCIVELKAGWKDQRCPLNKW